MRLVTFSFPLATFFVFLLVDFSKTTSFVYLKLGWMQDKENFIIFWLRNFGIFWPLIALMLFLEIPNISLITKINLSNSVNKFKKSKVFIYPAIFLFIVFCNVMMAPWEWDNCKLLIWPYLILLPYLWKVLISALDLQLKYLICFILFFSGFVCVFGGFKNNNGYEVFRFNEVAKVKKAIENLSVNNRFASFPTFGHPLLFCGRKVVLGYPGWIWSHGYNLKEREEELKNFMLGKENWEELAKKLEVKYVFWGRREQKEYSESTRPWETSGVKIASGDWGEIYDLSVEAGGFEFIKLK